VLTLRDLLRDLDVTVLAGQDAVDAPVRWVHISELADPTPWLSGGELLLTTGMALDTPEQQRTYVHTLADHGLAGLGFGIGLRHREVPDAVRETCEERGFTLVQVPYDVPFIAVTEKAFSRLVNEQYAVLQRSIAAQERLHRIVLSERGLDAIAEAIAQLIGGAAVVFDGRGEELARHATRRPLSDAVVDAMGHELLERARRAEGRGFVPSHEDLASRALALPVPASDVPERGVPQAWLVAAKDRGALSDVDRLVVHQAVTAVALELLRRRVADTTERRLAGDVLSEIVRGELRGSELVRRLEPFGLGGTIGALVLDARDAGRRAALACEGALAQALRDEAVTGLVASAGPLAVALLPGLPDPDLFELAERLHGRVARELGAEIAAGAGRAVDPERVRETYHEARCAMEARVLGAGASNGGSNGSGRARPAGARRVATFADLGSFQLLLSLQDSDALRLYCDSLLAPIEQGEGHYGGELRRSLEAFIECNGQWEAAARRLFCHRHTLRYRIRKIEELTGRDLGSARDRIEFWLALRGREIVT
jgi:purine catabolism regulator